MLLTFTQIINKNKKVHNLLSKHISYHIISNHIIIFYYIKLYDCNIHRIIFSMHFLEE